MSTETAVALAEDLSEDDIRRMLSHIKQLDEIRKDQHFWTVFLFQEGTESEFIREFEERQPKMLQPLKELEQVPVQLDSMNLWARISGVVGSSVVTVGGLLIIAGLGLIPFTDGGSLALTVMGLVIIGTNGVNATVTTATEIGVNTTQQQEAKEILKNFKEDLQSIQACLDEVITQQVIKLEARPIDMAAGVQRVLLKTGAIGTTGMGKVTAKGAVALSKSARVGLVGLNALFVGLDIFIYQDSTSLAKGSETEFSKSIRAIAARAAAAVDLWQKIYNSLKSEESRDLLEEPFYPQK
uniref:apolipoprotein L3-like n=1 Tax=Semicossyphus pulcher TaxID=241346 RepID=UPI0037E70830